MGITFMFKIICAPAAAVSANMLEDQSEDLRIIVHRRRPLRVLYAAARMGAYRTWGKHAAGPKGWARAKVGYMKLARMYGIKKLAMFMNWQRRTLKFWYKGGRATGMHRYRQYKKWGFKVWWRVYGKSARRLCGPKYGQRSWFKAALKASRLAWPKY